MTLLAALLSVVSVQEEDVPTALYLLWGAVIGGGILSLVLMSAGANSMNPSTQNFGRMVGRIALIAILPAVTLTCSAASN
jgi:hypothetical protein